MRVLTMNVFGHHRGWADRRTLLAAGLRDLVRDADLHVSAGGDPSGWIGSLVVVRIEVPQSIGRYATSVG